MSFVLCLSLIGTAFAAKPGDKVVIMVLDANGKLLDYPRVTLVAGEDGSAVLSPEDIKDIWEQGGRKYVLEEKEYDVIYTPPADHEHKYEWKFDADGHWQVCTNEDGKCDKPTTDKAAHNYGDDNICDICGYERTVTPATYIITLDANGGTVETTTLTTNEEGKLATLPTPTRSSYTFNGWFTEATGGTQITSDTVFTANSTIYAHWTSNGGGGGGGGGGSTTYTITAPSKVEHGKISVNRTSASQGSTITITVTPDEGYELGSLIVKDSKDKEITLTDAGNGKYTFKMPASKVTVSAEFKQTGSSSGDKDCSKDENCPVSKFTDVNVNAWYHDGVHYCLENGMMTGYGDNIFAPNDKTSRAMIATILWQLNGKPEADRSVQFDDVASGTWYANAVRWAASNQVVSGYGDGRFGPDDPITREQMAVMLYSYAKSKDYDITAKGDLDSFPDASTVSDWAKDAMSWANGAGLIAGNTNGQLNPSGNATRAEVATILMRFCENVAK